MNALMNQLYFKARMAFWKFTRDEDGAVDIVAIVVLIGIAVVVALIFKDAIVDLIESLFNGMKEEDVNKKPPANINFQN